MIFSVADSVNDQEFFTFSDYKTGFGGQYGVQGVQDKSAVGWEHHEQLNKHESQKDYAKGNCNLVVYDYMIG